MVDIPQTEPLEAVAGDTWKWKRSLADYPAGTWTLKYHFHKSSATFAIEATADGTDHAVTVARTTTANYTAGTYAWAAFVTSVTERFQIDSGTLIVLPDLSSTTPADRRAHAEKVLTAIEAVIENRASKDQESYSIQGRTLSRTPIAELIRLRSFYKAEVSRLRGAERVANGESNSRNLHVRF